eukprot:TRINITY_DN5382_c0_g1_i1.p1 TRINITY_DN5382_c0_g1~~TRINITY_DN5382_c0_g1_i1.p1  ORF type:complete len:1520 (-),score=430.47 TRINITY_DN5382_c0_g1_i1:9-4568(-)
MGVQGLWELLAPVGRRVSVETLANKKLAIDASIWLVQFMKAMRDENGEMIRNAHLIGFFRRICKLLFLRIKPVFVFDGGTPALKRRTVLARRRQRDLAQAKIRKTAEKLLLNHLKARKLEDLIQQIQHVKDTTNSANEASQGERDYKEKKAEVRSNSKVVDSNGKRSEAQSSSQTSDIQEQVLSKLNGRQESVDALLAASLSAEEQFEKGSYDLREDSHIGGSSDEEQIILPTFQGEVDPSVLAVLPPSMQLDLLAQMREQQMAMNRQKFRRVRKAPASFSELQIESYLKTVAFRREIDEIQKSASRRGVGGVQAARIASESTREFIFSSSFTGDKHMLQLSEKDKNETNDQHQSLASNVASVTSLLSGDHASHPDGSNENSDNAVQTDTYERGEASGPSGFSVHWTRDLQWNLYMMKEAEERTMGNEPSDVEATAVDMSEHNNVVESGLDKINSKVDGSKSKCLQISFTKDEIIQQHSDDEFFQALVAGENIANEKFGSSVCAQLNDETSDIEWEDDELNASEGIEASQVHSRCDNSKAMDLKFLSTNKDSELECEDTNDFMANNSSCSLEPSTSTKKRHLSEDEELQEAIKRSLEDFQRSNTMQSFSQDVVKEPLVGASRALISIDTDNPKDEERIVSSNALMKIATEDSTWKGKTDALFEEMLSRDSSADPRENSTNCTWEECGMLNKDINNKLMKRSFEVNQNALQTSSSNKADLMERGSYADALEGNSSDTGINRFSDLMESGGKCRCNMEGPETVCNAIGGVDFRRDAPDHFEKVDDKETISQDKLMKKVEVKHVERNNKDVAELLPSKEQESGKKIAFETELEVEKEAVQSNIHKGSACQEESEMLDKKEIILEDKLINEVEESCCTRNNKELLKREADLIAMKEKESKRKLEIETELEVQKEAMENNINEEIASLRQEELELRSAQKLNERNADCVSGEMFQECQELLQMFGLPYIIAPMEAEAQCAFMERVKLVEGVVTDDCDAFLFGADIVYKNIFDNRKYVETYLMKDIENELGLNREKLVRMALLLGSDYTEGISGIGIVNAIEVVNAFPEADGLKKFREWLDSPDPSILDKFTDNRGKTNNKMSKIGKTNRNMAVARQETALGSTERDEQEQQSDRTSVLKEIFMEKHRAVSKNWHVPEYFPNEAVISAYINPQVDKSTEPCSWGRPDLMSLRKFCWEKFGWVKEKADDLLLPVLKEYDRHETQLRLESFYTFSERFAKIRSRRIQKAVTGITGRRSSELMDLPPHLRLTTEKKTRKTKKNNSSKTAEPEQPLDPMGGKFSNKDGENENNDLYGKQNAGIQRKTYNQPTQRGQGRGRESRGRGRGKAGCRKIKATSEVSDSEMGDVELHLLNKPHENSQIRKSSRKRKHVNYAIDEQGSENIDCIEESADADCAAIDPPVEPAYTKESNDTHNLGVQEDMYLAQVNDKSTFPDYLTSGGGFCGETENDNLSVPDNADSIIDSSTKAGCDAVDHQLSAENEHDTVDGFPSGSFRAIPFLRRKKHFSQ